MLGEPIGQRTFFELRIVGVNPSDEFKWQACFLGLAFHELKEVASGVFAACLLMIFPKTPPACLVLVS
jgi:hypothetical protein